MDEAAGSSPPTQARRRRRAGRISGFRARVRALPGGALAWRVVITLLGSAIIAAGVVLLPLPGPGWLIIFGGLGLLATEYEWASRLLGRARGFVGGWTEWTSR
ncbi:MAG: PGPGW domain-containing protein, partial [Pseudonocardiales bacterium]